MLGEDHSLINEFPEHKDKINQINRTNHVFSNNAERYHILDAEIRELEINNAPIDDESLHQLKRERAELKDILYREIMTG